MVTAIAVASLNTITSQQTMINYLNLMKDQFSDFTSTGQYLQRFSLPSAPNINYVQCIERGQQSELPQ